MLLGRMQSSPSCPCPPSFCGWAKMALAGPFALHACTLLPWAWVSARWARPVGTRVVFPNDLRGCRSRGPGINRNAADSSLASALISTRISLNRSNSSASFPLAPYIKSWPLPPDCFTRATIVEPWSAERNRKPPRPSSCITVAGDSLMGQGVSLGPWERLHSFAGSGGKPGDRELLDGATPPPQICLVVASLAAAPITGKESLIMVTMLRTSCSSVQFDSGARGRLMGVLPRPPPPGLVCASPPTGHARLACGVWCARCVGEDGCLPLISLWAVQIRWQNNPWVRLICAVDLDPAVSG
jgi:hypothetical protein